MCAPLAIIFGLSFCITVFSFDINATGGSFPARVYQDATFAYQFLGSGDFVTYYGSSSTTGKCNIMGYWHNGDTSPSQLHISAATRSRDTLICTDSCTVATCGISSAISPRFDRASRVPLIDFAGTDSVLKAADYTAFPDLQMFPALAGAAVPVYNIPELSDANTTLLLSRQNLADIFKGEVRNWNDSRILINNPLLTSVLSKISSPIRVVVRTDSAGTSEIFTTALAIFDPMTSSVPDYSFSATIGYGSNPYWCGLLTDEIQIITIKGCNNTITAISDIIYMKVVTAISGSLYIHDLNFSCDASADNLTSAFRRPSSGPGLSLTITKTNKANGVVQFQIGCSDVKTISLQWYKPSVVSVPTGVTVSISTLQEGGYHNSHFNSTYFITPRIESIFVVSPLSTAVFAYNITWQTSTNNNYTVSLNSNYTSDAMTSAFNIAYPGSVALVKRVVNTIMSTTEPNWVEYQITFSSTTSDAYYGFKAKSVLNADDDNVFIMTLLDYNNYPVFYDYQNPKGYGNSGR